MTSIRTSILLTTRLPPPEGAVKTITYIAPTVGFGPIYASPNGPTPSTQVKPVPTPTRGPTPSTQVKPVPTPTQGEGPISRSSTTPPTTGRDSAPVPAKVPMAFGKKSRFIVAVAVVAAVVLAIFLYYKRMYKPEPKKEGTITSLSSSAVNIERKAAVQRHQVHSGLSSSLQTIVEMHAGLSSSQQPFLEPTEIYTNLTPDDIVYIKSYCRESRPIGEGSFARVYKMNYQGKVLAIKEIEHRTPHTKRWVKNEVDLLLGKEHININKLYAWCIEANISYLAYMYIDGCSLDDYLRGNCVGFTCSWVQSFSMIMGIAKGLEFLHSNKIIHVDIKPQNIMVDANDNEAKLVDFGFCRHVDWEGTHRSTDKVIGTKGYWAPEYCLNNKLSYKNDVFSLGVVVLEMITGQRHVDEARGSSQFHIPGYVRHMIENDRFEEAVDTKLKQDGWDIFAMEEAFAVAKLALRCAHPDKAKRPDMNLVLTELNLISSDHNNISLGQKEEEIALIMSR